jgi:hypothetical protein
MDGGERLLLLLTFGLTVLVDLTVAIAVGVTLASPLFMANMSQAASLRAEDQAGADESQRDELPPGVAVLRLEDPMFFGVATEMLDILQRMGRVPCVDSTVAVLDMGGVLALVAAFTENLENALSAPSQESPGLVPPGRDRKLPLLAQSAIGGAMQAGRAVYMSNNQNSGANCDVQPISASQRALILQPYVAFDFAHRQPHDSARRRAQPWRRLRLDAGLPGRGQPRPSRRGVVADDVCAWCFTA